MLAITDGQHTNKVAVHWAQKLATRKSQRYAFLDSGASAGTALEEDKQDFDNTGEISRKHSCSLTDAPGKQQIKCSSKITFN